MKIPKEMVGRRVDVLISGISTLELKITTITDTEIIATHADGEEIHVEHDAIKVWWLPKVRTVSKESLAKRRATIARRNKPDGYNS